MGVYYQSPGEYTPVNSRMNSTQGCDFMATFNEDVISRGFGGGEMGGSGGGMLMGLILGSLLRNGGLGGNGNDAAVLTNVATKDDLMQQTLGSIEASIPYNEAQVQLALSAAMASLTAQNTANTQHLSSEMGAAQLQAATTAALITRDIAAVDTNVDRQSTAIQIAIANDGAKTRDLITANQIASLNQQLTVAQLENAENRAIQREMSNSHNVTTTINTNQQQQQLQTQRQDFMLNTLVNGFGQLARSTNSQVVVGSNGVTGTQSANPTNVMA